MKPAIPRYYLHHELCNDEISIFDRHTGIQIIPDVRLVNEFYDGHRPMKAVAKEYVKSMNVEYITYDNELQEWLK